MAASQCSTQCRTLNPQACGEPSSKSLYVTARYGTSLGADLASLSCFCKGFTQCSPARTHLVMGQAYNDQTLRKLAGTTTLKSDGGLHSPMTAQAPEYDADFRALVGNTMVAVPWLAVCSGVACMMLVQSSTQTQHPGCSSLPTHTLSRHLSKQLKHWSHAG